MVRTGSSKVKEGETREGGGRPERSWTNWRVPTQRAPIIANFEAEKVGRKDQSCVGQGRLSNALPTKAGTGQNRSQCCTELSPCPHRTQGRSIQERSVGSKWSRLWRGAPFRGHHRGDVAGGNGGCR